MPFLTRMIALLPEEACDFIPGAFVLLQAVKKGLVVKLFPLDSSSQIINHDVFPQDRVVRAKYK